MNTVLAVAPHPDDETLGCGGTLLRHAAKGDAVHWLIITHITEDTGFSEKRVASREREINQVADQYGMASTTNLAFPTTRLDVVPMGDLVSAISEVVHAIAPKIMYLPYRNDIHTDHAAVFDAVAACTKWFRYPSVKRVLVYETLSETDFVIDPDCKGFNPNSFTDISDFIDEKIKIMNSYESEVGLHPFPRSEAAIRALATLRGAAAGVSAAEGFMLLRERITDD